MTGQIIQYLRRIVRLFYRKRLRNTSFSLITNNCIGGVISHDMHLQFRSPTINLFFTNQDFVVFLEHLNHYLSLDLVQAQSDKSYPVGKLTGEYGDVYLFFMHYTSFEEAKKKWQERIQRIDFDRLFIIMEAQECEYELLQRFDSLPFQNKVVITGSSYSGIQSCFSMEPSFYVHNYHSGKILEYPRMGIKRYLDRFDYVEFFNNGRIRRRWF